MKNTASRLAFALALTLASTALLAQSTTTTRPGSRTGSYAQPYQGSYWNYGGISVGRSHYDYNCPAGFNCDRHETGFKAFVGGKSSENFGLEASYVYLGKGHRGGGDTWGQGLNLSLIGSVPLGQMAALNGKVGGIYSWTKTEGFAPGMRTGSDHGLGISYGVGLSFAVTRTVDLRLDWDRYRMKFETGRNYADLASVGVAFKF